MGFGSHNPPRESLEATTRSDGFVPNHWEVNLTPTKRPSVHTISQSRWMLSLNRTKVKVLGKPADPTVKPRRAPPLERSRTTQRIGCPCALKIMWASRRIQRRALFRLSRDRASMDGQFQAFRPTIVVNR